MDKEFEFTEADFRKIKSLVSEHTGISLSDAKQDMIYSRLAKRLRQLGLVRFKEYLDIISAPSSDELVNFINSVTTNLTSFFREKHHFEYLKNTLIPTLMVNNCDTKIIRIWSAGCSTGEEPYSIAMTVKDVVPDNQGWDIRILATDLDSNVLSKAKSGVYSIEKISGIPKDKIRRWFHKGRGELDGMVRVSDSIKDMVIFKQLNLMSTWPIRSGVDILFCRNVVIYFDKPTQTVLFNRYANILKPNGHLFIGHSETLYKVSDRFRLIGNTIYKRIY